MGCFGDDDEVAADGKDAGLIGGRQEEEHLLQLVSLIQISERTLLVWGEIICRMLAALNK